METSTIVRRVSLSEKTRASSSSAAVPESWASEPSGSVTMGHDHDWAQSRGAGTLGDDRRERAGPLDRRCPDPPSADLEATASCGRGVPEVDSPEASVLGPDPVVPEVLPNPRSCAACRRPVVVARAAGLAIRKPLDERLQPGECARALERVGRERRAERSGRPDSENPPITRANRNSTNAAR